MDGEPLTRRWRIDPECASLSIDRLVVRRGRVLHVDSVQLRADRREMAAEREAGGRATGTRREHNVVERERLGRRRRTPSSSRLGGGGGTDPCSLGTPPSWVGSRPSRHCVMSSSVAEMYAHALIGVVPPTGTTYGFRP